MAIDTNNDTPVISSVTSTAQSDFQSGYHVGSISKTDGISDASSDLSNEDAVVLLPGSYTLSSTLSVPANTTFFIREGATITQDGSANLDAMVDVTGDGATVVLNGALVGDKDQSSGNGRGVTIGSNNGVTLKGSGTVKDCKDKGVRAGGATNCTIKGIRAENCGGAGVNFPNSDFCLIHEVDAVNNDNNGILGFGGGSARSNPGFGNVVSNCTARDNGDGGIFLNAQDATVVTGCSTSGNGDHGQNLEYCQHSAITDAVSYQDQNAGVGLFIGCKYCFINGAYVLDTKLSKTDNNGNGVHVLNSDGQTDCFVSNVTAADCDGNGVRAVAPNTHVSNVYARNCGQDPNSDLNNDLKVGVALRNNKGRADTIIAEDNNFDGIWLDEPDITLVNFRSNGNANRGIQLRDPDGRISHGTVTNNGADGVFLNYSTGECSMREMRISGNTGSRIGVSSSNRFIEDGWSENAGDPSSTGQWNTESDTAYYRGTTVVDTSNEGDIYIPLPPSATNDWIRISGTAV